MKSWCGKQKVLSSALPVEYHLNIGSLKNKSCYAEGFNYITVGVYYLHSLHNGF